ncbi:hypothetical protein DPMN_191671 [Dreissena polymorpha]|uniref:Uncharacterized protein n=1 Tax=Dreissena polymorpha TaxID=45954 RepID=A0A9D3Y2X2_DREPO|nr:hypothetical protein DPMN_191671 [Dreissena polymorpha]
MNRNQLLLTATIKNCFKLGQICGFDRDSCYARDTEYGSNASLCCIRLSGGENVLLSDRYGYCVPSYAHVQ